jgi:hypothetical protein
LISGQEYFARRHLQNFPTRTWSFLLLQKHASVSHKYEKIPSSRDFLSCARARDRTWDNTSISRVLYQLSYTRKFFPRAKRGARFSNRRSDYEISAKFHNYFVFQNIPKNFILNKKKGAMICPHFLSPIYLVGNKWDGIPRYGSTTCCSLKLLAKSCCFK